MYRLYIKDKSINIKNKNLFNYYRLDHFIYQALVFNLGLQVFIYLNLQS